MKRMSIVLLGFIVSADIAKAMDDGDEGLTSFVKRANSWECGYISSSDERLKLFVKRLNTLFEKGEISSCEEKSHTSRHQDVWPINFSVERREALSEDNLNSASLETKYNCIRDIYESFNKNKQRVGFACTPELTAEAILMSFTKTKYAAEESKLGAMHAFLKYIYPHTINVGSVVKDIWAPYATRQARNTVLNQQLRMKFANLYPKCSGNTDKEAFAEKLRYEICPSDHKRENIANILPLKIEDLTAELQLQESTTTRVDHILELKDDIKTEPSLKAIDSERESPSETKDNSCPTSLEVIEPLKTEVLERELPAETENISRLTSLEIVEPLKTKCFERELPSDTEDSLRLTSLEVVEPLITEDLTAELQLQASTTTRLEHILELKDDIKTEQSLIPEVLESELPSDTEDSLRLTSLEVVEPLITEDLTAELQLQASTTTRLEHILELKDDIKTEQSLIPEVLESELPSDTEDSLRLTSLEVVEPLITEDLTAELQLQASTTTRVDDILESKDDIKTEQSLKPEDSESESTSEIEDRANVPMTKTTITQGTENNQNKRKDAGYGCAVF